MEPFVGCFRLHKQAGGNPFCARRFVTMPAKGPGMQRAVRPSRKGREMAAADRARGVDGGEGAEGEPAPEVDGAELEEWGEILDHRPASLNGDTVAMALAERLLRVRGRDGFL